MDIVFQRGDFYLENGQHWTDVLKDVVLPIATLLLGYWLSTWNEKRKEKKRISKLLDLLTFETQALPKILRAQRKSFDDFSAGLGSGDITVFGVSIIHNLVGIDRKFEKFGTIDVLDGLYERYHAKEHDQIRKRVYNLLEAVRLTGRAVIEMEGLKVSGITKVNIAKDDIKKVIHDLADEIRDYPVKAKNESNLYKDFMKEAVAILNSHLQSEKKGTLYYGADTLIKPLIIAAERHANNCQYARGMLKQLYLCSNHYRIIETEVNTLIGNVTALSESLKMSEASITDALEVLQYGK